MDNNLNKVLELARSVGTVTNCEMSEACKFLPARIEINGITPGGEAFEIRLRVGEPKDEDS